MDGLHRFVVSVHALNAVKLGSRPSTADLVAKATSLWMQKAGTPTGENTILRKHLLYGALCLRSVDVLCLRIVYAQRTARAS